jgi:heptosyltransferase I
MKLKSLTPERVLICRLSAIGDCIHTLPLAVRIKQLWPNCTLTWAVDCAASQLLEGHSAVDKILKVERHWVKNTRQWKPLREQLRNGHFDIAFDPQGLIKSGLLAWLSGARVRLGFNYSQARELAPFMSTHRIQRTARHMVDTYLELLSPWESTPANHGQFNMPVYEAAAEKIPEILSASGLDSGEPFLCITPGAGWPTKIWSVERFAEVARQLHKKLQLRAVVVWAGENERLMANVIAEQSGGAAVAAPKTNLTELAELVRRAELFLGGDTGPLHLAAAMGTRCVGLYGPTWGDEAGPYGTQNIGVQSPELPSRGRTKRRGPNTAMQAIDTDEVLLACFRLLESTSESTRAAA